MLERGKEEKNEKREREMKSVCCGEEGEEGKVVDWCVDERK